MTTKDHLQMHQDHRVWTSDINMWIHDVKMWGEELEALNSSMDIIMDKIKDHEISINDHNKNLIYHNDVISQHDTKMVMLTRGSSTDEELSELHHVGSLRHTALKLAHEKMKGYQHSVMISVKNLRATLENFNNNVREIK